MNPTYLCMYISLFLLFFVVIPQLKKRPLPVSVMKKRKGKPKMYELAQKLIGKNCYITAGASLKGVIKEVTQGGILVENGQQVYVINLDYISYISVIPDKKKK